MTYPAPRQGRFAVLILVSLCLHILLFVITLDRDKTALNQAFADELSVSLSEELKLPLVVNDRVGMAVILNRYKSDERLSYVGVYDKNDTLLVPLGQSYSENLKKMPIADGQETLGFLAIETSAFERVDILKSHWPFLLGAFLLHSMIWLLYYHIARPSRRLKESIYQEARTKLLSQGLIGEQSASIGAAPSIAASKPASVDIQEVLIRLTKSDSASASSSDSTKRAQVAENAQVSTPSQKAGLGLIAPQSAERAALCIRFDDKHGLFGVLEDHALKVYCDFCDELLHKVLANCLGLPSLAGVKVVGVERFSQAGARVYLAKTKKDARLMLACALIAELMLECYQVIYDKHREFGMFGLPIKVITTSEHQKTEAVNLLDKHDKKHLFLINDDEFKPLGEHFESVPLAPEKLSSPYEKEIKVIITARETSARILNKLKLSVLS